MLGGKGKRSFINHFRISDRASCQKAIRNGGIAAMVSAGVTALFAILGFFTSSSNEAIASVLDPWNIVDVVLVIVLGIFIFRKSRVASTLMVIYFALSKALVWYEMGEPQGWFLSAIFFLYFITAMRGTYIWHTSYKSAPS